MRKVALLAGFTLILISVKTISAQINITNDYVILTNDRLPDQASYEVALDAANWELYRLQDKRFKLSFDNGLTIELKSAAELIIAGHSLILSSYPIEKPQGYIPPTLKLLPGNMIGMEIQQSSPVKH